MSKIRKSNKGEKLTKLAEKVQKNISENGIKPLTRKDLYITDAERRQEIEELARQINGKMSYRFMFDFLSKEIKDGSNC